MSFIQDSCMGRDSERNPHSLLWGQQANQEIDRIPIGEDALRLAAGYASIISPARAGCKLMHKGS